MQGETIPVNDHHPVSAQVHPSVIRVSLDDGMRGAKIAIAIQFMKTGDRKFQDIDLITGEGVFLDRTGRDEPRRNRAKVFRFLIPVIRDTQAIDPIFGQAKGLGNLSC